MDYPFPFKEESKDEVGMSDNMEDMYLREGRAAGVTGEEGQCSAHTAPAARYSNHNAHSVACHATVRSGCSYRLCVLQWFNNFFS